MTAVAIASIEDIKAAVAELLDAQAPLVVDRAGACRMLKTSDATFGRLVHEGVIQPVPGLRPSRYSINLLRRFVDGERDVFAQLAGASTSAENPPSAGVDGLAVVRGDGPEAA